MKRGPKPAITAAPLDVSHLPKSGGLRVIRFIESYLRIPRGVGALEPVKLRPQRAREQPGDEQRHEPAEPRHAVTAAADGPIQVRPASMTAVAKPAFSERNPYPGWTASAPANRAASNSASISR